MKVILAMVTSLDGKSTKGDLAPQSWASKEDQAFFSSIFKTNKLFLMGSKTYLAAKKTIKPDPKKLKIVLTRNPKKFVKNSVKGQLEFSNDEPKEVIRKLNNLGFNQLILLGGASTTSLFLTLKLVDEIWLTLEPKIFGEGKGLVDQSNLDINLHLQAFSKLNSQGTLLLKYQVIK